MKHTKGPWKIVDHEEEYLTITDDDQSFGVCRCIEAESESRSAMTANARLIASAPELLELLIEARDGFLGSMKGSRNATRRDQINLLLEKIQPGLSGNGHTCEGGSK